MVQTSGRWGRGRARQGVSIMGRAVHVAGRIEGKLLDTFKAVIC